MSTAVAWAPLQLVNALNPGFFPVTFVFKTSVEYFVFNMGLTFAVVRLLVPTIPFCQIHSCFVAQHNWDMIDFVRVLAKHFIKYLASNLGLRSYLLPNEVCHSLVVYSYVRTLTTNLLMFQYPQLQPFFAIRISAFVCLLLMGVAFANILTLYAPITIGRIISNQAFGVVHVRVLH